MKTKLLLTALLASTLLASNAFANEGTALSQKEKTVAEHQAYQYEFDRDEACQGYASGVKRLGMDNACAKKEEPVIVEEVIVEEVVVVEEIVYEEPVKVLKEYVIYFDTNSADVADSERGKLNEAAQQIRTYNPSDVLVAGYTDTRGDNDYNTKLSAKRARTVSQILSVLGVSNNVVNESALGESNLAVQTDDNVENQANRRVQIQFVQ